MYLGAVQTDGAQLEQLHFLGQFQHLHKQSRQLVQKAPAEGRQRVVVWMRPRRDIPKSHRIVGGPLQPAAGEHAGGVAIHQYRQQGGRVVGLRAASCILPRQFR